MSYLKQYFQFNELYKDKKTFKINYTAIKREMWRERHGGDLWLLKYDENYHRKASPRIFKNYLIDRGSYKLGNKVNVFNPSKFGIKDTLFDFLDYFELIMYFQTYEDELLKYEDEIKDKYVKNYVPILDKLIEQFKISRIDGETDNYIINIARHILLDIIYIINFEIKNRDKIKDISYYLQKYTYNYKVLWVIDGVRNERNRKESELESANHNNVFQLTYNNVFNLCHRWKTLNDRKVPYYNQNKLKRFNRAYQWGYIDINEIRNIYLLSLLNFNIEVVNEIKDIVKYLNTDNKLFNNYDKFLTYYYDDMYKSFYNSVLNQFKSFKQNIDLITHNTSKENLRNLPQYETFKGLIYYSLFDEILSQYHHSNETSKIKRKFNPILRNTFLLKYNKSIRDDVRERYIFRLIIIHFDKIDKELDIENNNIPITKLFNWITSNIPNIGDEINKIQLL